MKTIEIKWRKKTSTVVSQIYSSGLEYCFVSKDNEQCNRLVFCKDFLQDCVWARMNMQKAEIYEFAYDPNRKPLVDLSKTRIALGNSSDKDFGERIGPMLEFITYFDRKLKLKPTEVLKCSNPPKRYVSGVYVLEASKKWLSAPPLLSMYTLLLRVGLGHDSKNKPLQTLKMVAADDLDAYGEDDNYLVGEALEGISKILANGRTKLFGNKMKNNYPKNITIDDMHDCCGIVGYATGDCKRFMKHWKSGVKNVEYLYS